VVFDASGKLAKPPTGSKHHAAVARTEVKGVPKKHRRTTADLQQQVLELERSLQLILGEPESGALPEG
jgi:hypothetical protein